MGGWSQVEHGGRTEMSRRYAFGDSDTAAIRLAVVAKVFEPATREFLETLDLGTPGLVIDLGCGPGYTTALLAEVLRPLRTIGLDVSPPFLDRARRDRPTLEFLVHDVTALPFPVGPPDLLFCRYLLTHLEDPVGWIARWGTSLPPGGLLALEEPEEIHTSSPVFSTYLEIVDEMLQSQANQLYVGRDLDRAPAPPPLVKRASRLGELRVSPVDAATMFSLNLQTWKQHPFVRKHRSAAEVSRLERDLAGIRDGEAEGVELVWNLRQLVYERMEAEPG